MQLQQSSTPFSSRGINPKILLEQLHNTAPFLLDKSFGDEPYLRIIRDAASRVENDPTGSQYSHEDYYRLCVAAHWSSVATYVPTDVDNQIRFRLWSPSLPIETVQRMVEFVLETRDWDFRPVTRRYVVSPSNGYAVSGHRGEWLSIAAAAYGATRKRDPELAAKVGGAIVRELQAEAALFVEMRERADGISLMKTAAAIAHNLGDLDRVLEMWNTPDDDALKTEVFKLGHRQTSAFQGVFHLAGAMNKSYLAIENHRNFALRKPRCLRRSSDFLIETPPFLDDWGSRIARHPLLEPKDVAEVAESLVDGWEYLAKTAATVPEAPPVGYARALAGILDAFPGGLSALSEYLPARIGRTLKNGPLRALIGVDRRRYQDQWNRIALKACR